MDTKEYLKLLEEKIDRNSKKLNAIYEILSQTNKPKVVNTNLGTTKVNNTTQTKLYPKNVKLLEAILDKNQNEKTEAFLLSIINNSYPTITEGQQKVIIDLANLYNLPSYVD